MINETADYRGARFFKCDLQCQTPEDGAHWAQGDALRLPNPRVEGDLQEKARRYLRRCHEIELEVIAVTDHNFSSRTNEREWFLSHLIQQNGTVAEEVGRAPLIIFPGFELDIGYHMLCLFEPRTPLRELSTCLTTLGLAPEARFQDGRPVPCRFEGRPRVLDTLLKVVQDQRQGIVIAAHAFSTDGIADTGRDASDYQDKRLLAVEVSAVPLPGRAQGILYGNDPAWRRRRRPAYIMSSDCKKLAPENDTDSNYLGYRHTWIKMSMPSVEALRQAFLDQDSRIRFGDTRPESSYEYPTINRIAVTGASFLADHSSYFSPNLNTLIGGRGTGKSTIVEYLRLALGQEDAIRGGETKRNLARLKQTVLATTSITVDIEKEGCHWRISKHGDSAPEVEEGEPIPEIARFFPVRILSQKEIYAIAEDREARGNLVDNLIRSALDEVERQAQDIINEVRLLNEQIATALELTQRKRELTTERLTIQARLDRLKPLEEPLKNWKGMLGESTFLSDLGESTQSLGTTAREMLESIAADPTAVPEELSESPNAALLGRLADRHNALVDELRTSVEEAISRYERECASMLAGEEITTWRAQYAAAEEEYEKLREELLAEGTDPEQYLEYERALAQVNEQIADLDQRIGALAETRTNRDQKLDELTTLWGQQAQIRIDKATQLTDAVPKTENGEPFVKVAVESFGDDRAFAAKMQDLIQDHRRIGQGDWGEFDEQRRTIHPSGSFLASAYASRGDEESPVAVVCDWITQLRAGNQPDGCPWPSDDRRTQVLLEWCDDAVLAELRLWRPSDRVRVELYRQDGSRVGELEEGLSVGQRCTAVLALLLAQDDVPAIIDQPEEDLDNEFVYRELVPLLRKIKEQRQLLIATHNANIVVNADAELILALEVREERGRVKECGGQACEGALDNEAARQAVEDIMEGSEDAFRRRFEKYGF